MSDTKKGLASLLQCGSCTFRERDKLFEKRCSELGKLPSAKACASHTSDAFSLIESSEDDNALSSLGSIIANYGPTELNALASLLLREKQTRKLGYTFYQKVYVRLQGHVKNNYFSNFVTGRILDATKEHVRIVGLHGKNMVCVYAINEKESTTFYTTDRFYPIRKAMAESSRYIDPECMGGPPSGSSLRGRICDLASSESLEILEVSAHAKRRLKKAPTDDLVRLVSRLARGVSKPKRSTGDEEIRIIG